VVAHDLVFLASRGDARRCRFARLPSPYDAVPESPCPEHEQPLARRPPRHGLVDAQPLVTWQQTVTRAVAQAVAAVADRRHRAFSVAEWADRWQATGLGEGQTGGKRPAFVVASVGRDVRMGDPQGR